MKRAAIASVIILALFAVSIWSIAKIDRITNEICCLLDYAEAAADEGRFSDALELSRTALNVWLGAESYTHIFIRHPEIDGTSDAFYELLSVISEADSDSLAPAFEKLRYHLSSIDSMEHLSLGSIM